MSFSASGRTFPTHPYFQAQLGAGQLSLYNILKAYSLLDPEVSLSTSNGGFFFHVVESTWMLSAFV